MGLVYSSIDHSSDSPFSKENKIGVSNLFQPGTMALFQNTLIHEQLTVCDIESSVYGVFAKNNLCSSVAVANESVKEVYKCKTGEMICDSHGTVVVSSSTSSD